MHRPCIQLLLFWTIAPLLAERRQQNLFWLKLITLFNHKQFFVNYQKWVTFDYDWLCKKACIYLLPSSAGLNCGLFAECYTTYPSFGALSSCNIPVDADVPKTRVFWWRFGDPIRVPRIASRVPRISENCHRFPRIRENRVPRIREIGFLQVHTRYLTFSLKKPCEDQNLFEFQKLLID